MTLGGLIGLKLLPCPTAQPPPINIKTETQILWVLLSLPKPFFFQNIVPLLPPLIRKPFTKNALTIVSSFHQTMRVRQDSHRGADMCV